MIYSDLSIIIPCKNESKNLEFIIPKLKEYSNEIIVVDANSNDGTKELCELHKIIYLKDKYHNSIGMPKFNLKFTKLTL